MMETNMKKRLLTFILAVILVSSVIPGNAFAVSSMDFTDDELDSSSYELRKYVTPYWEGNIVYNEDVFPIRREDGTLEPFTLMYDADEIISVYNYNLNVKYVEGRDYVLEDGKLVILPSGNITVYDYEYIHPRSNPNNYEWGVYYPCRNGIGYEYWNENSQISNCNIVVTYIHNDTWDAEIPASMAERLPKTMSRLMNNQKLKIVYNGDSVTCGCCSSSMFGMSPYCDAYPLMLIKALKDMYGNENITYANTAIGGTMSDFTASGLQTSVFSQNPDLVIINYGMNDSSCDRVGISDERFENNIRGRIEAIQSRLPNCEIILLSSMYGNIYTFPKEKYESHAALLHVIADDYDGVAVCDPQAVMDDLLLKKDYVCFMADNMVHPNDYGMRLMCQSLLEALSYPTTAEYNATLKNRLTTLAALDSHLTDGKYDEVSAILENAFEDLDKAQNEFELSDTYKIYAESITTVNNRCVVHTFTDTVTLPTCKEAGFTYSVCSVCGFSYRHDNVPALGGEHIFSESIITSSPTYKEYGESIRKCAKCGYEETTKVAKLTNPPMTDDYAMHVSNDLSYRQGPYNVYTNGGIVELDVCPLDISSPSYVPYFGLWIGDYAVCLCYNFKDQQFQIVANSLPFVGTPTIYKSYDYEWKPSVDGYNWHKLAFAVLPGYAGIYLDGKLILSDNHSRYNSSANCALFYSIGEYYFDNVKIGTSSYNPATSYGSTLYSWNFNSEGSMNSYNDEWTHQYATVSRVRLNEAQLPDYNLNHKHSGTAYNVIAPTCDHQGYTEYMCNTCHKLYRNNYVNQTCYDGHHLYKQAIDTYPTETENGLYTYKCLNCDMSFNEIIPAGTEVTPIVTALGDINDDGEINTTDCNMLSRFIAGFTVNINYEAADVNCDGNVNSTDYNMLIRFIAGYTVTLGQ